MNRIEACAVLGIEWPTNTQKLKNAYREKCKQYHPDNNSDSIAMYLSVTDAYIYLEKELKSISNNRTVRIIGKSPAPTGRDKAAFDRKMKLIRERQKEEKRIELEKRVQRIKNEEKANELLEQIRWIRLASVIQDTIKNDRNRSELENKLDEEIRKKQNGKIDK